jgi:4-amino-4-deoxy-L-arabinose transferase-like glycosyltransferase
VPPRTITRLFLLLAVSILPVLGLAKISGSSEAREAHVAQVIVNTAEWVLPDRNGFVPSKPILHHWLIASFSFLTNTVDEFSARLPSALLGILLIVLLYSFAQKLLQVLAPKDNSLALFAALILCSSYGFFRMFFSSMVDLSFAFFCCLAMLTGIKPLLLALAKKQAQACLSRYDWILFFVFCGLATLAKGPLGFVLPCLFLGVFYCSSYGIKAALSECLRPKIAWIFFILIACPWYVLAYFKAESAFLERQLFFENFQRFFGGENVNSEPFWFYLPSLLSRMAPWSFVLIVALIVFAKSKKELALQPQIKIIKALGLSLLACLALFSFSAGKRHSYLLPLFPVFTLLLIILINFIRASETIAQPSKLIFTVQNYLKKQTFSMFFFGLARYLSLLMLACLLLLSLFFLISKPEQLELIISSDFILGNFLRLAFAPVLALSILCYCRRVHALSQKKSARPDLALSSLFLFCATFSSLIASINGIKGEFRNYPQMAADMLKQAGPVQIVAVRNKYDELLDPIFFYLAKPVKVYAENEISSVCDGTDRLLLIRKDVFLGLAEKDRFVEESYYQELVGNPNSIKRRAISAVRCRDSG